MAINLQAACCLLTEHRRPIQITLCAFTGGAERWLTVRFDLSRSPLTFVQQVRDALPRTTGVSPDGYRSVVFFGAVNGFVVNYSPDRAVRYDLLGNPLEVLTTAYRCCELTLSAAAGPAQLVSQTPHVDFHPKRASGFSGLWKWGCAAALGERQTAP